MKNRSSACFVAALLITSASAHVAAGRDPFNRNPTPGIPFEDVSVLITIDPTDPSAVVFSATGAVAAVTDLSAPVDAGVTFDDLFAADFDLTPTQPVSVIGTLTAFAVPEYDSGANGFGGLSLLDLNLFNPSSSEAQSFSTFASTFTGSSTIDLTGATFGPIGSIGDILVGDTNIGSGVVIGQFQIVPEPASAALLGLAGTMLFRGRVHRRRQGSFRRP